MRIAVEGCTHGELEQTYHTIQQIEQQDGRKVRKRNLFRRQIVDIFLRNEK